MITTFYAENAAAARSDLVADVATGLAGWGYHVLCVDWNLDGTGVTSRLSPPGRATVGVVDLIRSAGSSSEPPPDPMSLPGFGRLDLLAAPGRKSAGTPIDWAGLQRELRVGDFLEITAESWRANYDAVLIDAPGGRGVGPGICVAQLADALVLLVPPGSGAGAAAILERADAVRDGLPYDRPRLLTLPCSTTAAAESALDPRLAAAVEDWADRDVPVDRLVEALAVERGARVLKALLALELRNTDLLATAEGANEYVEQAKKDGLAAPPDPLESVRSMATEALNAVLNGILPADAWVSIERAVGSLSRALDETDASGVSESVADLVGASVRSGERHPSPIPAALRLQVNQLLRRLEVGP